MPAVKVIVESPFGSDDIEIRKANVSYVRDACRDCVRRGENPFASHLFYTQFMDDADPADRSLGIQLGYDRWTDADSIVFYLDLGMSPGMQKALCHAFALGIHIERRWLGRNLVARPVENGRSIEEIMNDFAKELAPDAVDQDARTDRTEDRVPEGVGSGVDIQRP